VVFKFGFVLQVLIDHLADWRRPVHVIVSIYLLLRGMWKEGGRGEVPGNRRRLTVLPSAESAASNFWACVVFPDLSSPSTTIKAPLTLFCS
jgi:hypothetical protein